MSGRSVALAGLSLFALVAWLSIVLGVWPVRTPPPAQRADLRAQLEARHRADGEGNAPAARPQVDAPPEPLPVLALCEQPRAGRVTWLDAAGVDGPRLLVPCGSGVDVWSLSGEAAELRLRVELPGDGLVPGVALGSDVNGDGVWDLMLALQAAGPSDAYRQGLYWVRGRTQGGFEAPDRLLPLPVDGLLELEPPGSWWAAVHEPAPTSRALLWQLARGPLPSKRQQWELPGVADALRPAPPAEGEGVWVLAGGRLWRVSDDPEAPLQRLLEIEGARGLTHGEEPFALVPGGVRPVRRDATGALSLGEREGPAGVDSLAVSADGTRFAVVAGALWTWRPGGEARALEGVGGAHVETVLVSTDGRVWWWMSGLAGAQTTGLARLPAGGLPRSPVELTVRAVAPRGPVPTVRVP